jgi:hypothetical protein
MQRRRGARARASFKGKVQSKNRDVTLAFFLFLTEKKAEFFCPNLPNQEGFSAKPKKDRWGDLRAARHGQSMVRASLGRRRSTSEDSPKAP